MNTTIDARLLALYNEYLKAGKEYEFIDMLYAILDQATEDVRRKVMHNRAAQKRKEGAPVRKILKNKVEEFFNSMSPEELIKFQNTPYEELPEWLKEALPKIVQNPEACNFVRIYDLVHKNDRQQEIAASRITRYMEKHRLVTTMPGYAKPVLDYKRFAKICNEYAVNFDLPWGLGRKAQRVRITARDLQNYTECRVTPKGDKLAILASVTNLPVWYLCGYGKSEAMPSNNKHPLTNKYTKNRSAAVA